MDPRLLRAYNEELTYLREAGREFGQEHEVVAGHLGLKTPHDPDPYVERLMEGVAFLAARVNLKISDQFPEFTQHLLQAIQPNYLSPTPSICIVELKPEAGDPAMARGVPVERLTRLTGKAPGHDTPVTFRTGHKVELLPLKISEVEYLPTRASLARYAAAADVRAEAGLRLRFTATAGPLSAMSPEHLPLYLAGSELVPGELYRQLVADAVAVVAADDRTGAVATGLPLPLPHGFEDDCALLPHEQRSFRGYRILSEYFACPERFLFADLPGLGEAFSRCDTHCDVVILFKRSASALIEAVGPNNLVPFCTPAINLFEMQLGRTPVSPFEHEHLVVPDRTRPLDYEVFRLLEVTAYGRSLGSRPTAPLYAFGALLYDWRDAIFHVSRRRLRRLSTREQRLRRRNDYVGTETYISLAAPAGPERLEDIYELGVRALVTNRELPEMLRFSENGADLALDDGGPVAAVKVVRAPTRPRPPLGLNDAAWRVISHLTPNYASLIDAPGGSPDLLKDHLALYGRADDPVMRRQIDGILAVTSTPVTRRVSGVHRLAFGRGLLARIKLDDASFENGRMVLFGAVLDRFLAEFASVNSFVETVIESQDQGELAAWPTQVGRRPTI